MSTFEGKYGLVVIEQRGLPLVRVVASGTVCRPFAELIGMWVFMTIPAIDGRFRELYVRHSELKIRRAMALTACHCSMRSNQREPCTVMIELRDILPLSGCVAGLASQRPAIGSTSCHLLRKLPFVDVFVATGAAEIGKMIWRYFRTGQRLVTVIAGHCLVSAGEGEAGFLMLGKRVTGGLERSAVVAVFTLVVPRSSCKLAIVLILVAIEALREAQLEARVFACGDVARSAGHFFVRKR